MTKHFYWNVFTLQQKATLEKTGTTEMLKTVMLFHSQFELDYFKYRDNNNYIRHNLLQFTTSRWNLAPTEYRNEFLDFTFSPVWIGETFMWELNTTRDFGESWNTEIHRMIFGVYFFLNEDKVERFKNLSNVAEMIAILEGLASLLFLFIAIVPRYIN